MKYKEYSVSGRYYVSENNSSKGEKTVQTKKWATTTVQVPVVTASEAPLACVLCSEKSFSQKTLDASSQYRYYDGDFYAQLHSGADFNLENFLAKPKHVSESKADFQKYAQELADGFLIVEDCPVQVWLQTTEPRLVVPGYQGQLNWSLHESKAFYPRFGVNELNLAIRYSEILKNFAHLENDKIPMTNQERAPIEERLVVFTPELFHGSVKEHLTVTSSGVYITLDRPPAASIIYILQFLYDTFFANSANAVSYSSEFDTIMRMLVQENKLIVNPQELNLDSILDEFLDLLKNTLSSETASFWLMVHQIYA